MTMVIDVSIAMAWLLPDEHSDAADDVLRQLRATAASVPSLFWHEARNACLMAERRGRLAKGEAPASMVQLRRLPLNDAGSGTDHIVLTLAAAHGLSAYDAAYLALAIAEAAPLATTDRKLADAARRENVKLLGPLGG